MLTILLLTTLLALLIIQHLWKRSKLPPGPIPLPILGNLPQIGWMVAKHGGIVAALKEWKKQYGPVFTIWMGPQPTVHICTMELAQEIMVKRGTEFTDRWVPLMFRIPRNGLGIIGTNGHRWVEQRRFSLHTLRNFGLGRSLMEDRIMLEFNLRADRFDKEHGDEWIELNPKPFFDMMVGSIINRMLFNEALDERNGAEFYERKREVEQLLENLSFLDLFLQKEFLLKLPILRQRVSKIIKPQLGVKAFLRKQIEERVCAVASGEHVIADEPEDYVDAYLKMMEEEKIDPMTTFDKEALGINILDLWVAGQETTVTTILAGLAHLLHNPEVVTKVREELRNVINEERHLSLKDRVNTPYLNATIMEIQRHASIININLFRRTKEDIVVNGHPVAKDTPINAEISVLMSDEAHFQETQKFDPSRFLNSDRLDQYVVPFGLGKRSCLGESLARAELYLIIGNLILRYHIEPSDELPSLTKKNNAGILNRPNKYTMRIRKI